MRTSRGLALSLTTAAVFAGAAWSRPATAPPTRQPPAASRPATQPIVVPVSLDRRVELTDIIFRLAGSREYTQCRIPAYAKDLYKHFGPFKDHPAHRPTGTGRS